MKKRTEYPPLWKQLQDRCEHFNGLMNDQCDAGVAYESVKDTSTKPSGFPCLKWEDRPACTTTCGQATFLTDEQAQAQADEITARARAWMEREAAGFCGQCDQQVERKAQVGRCIYNEPCGCRVGQGRLSQTGGRR